MALKNGLFAIVDDDASMRKVLNLFLQNEGINTTQYVRGEDLLVALDKGSEFYAVLMDTNMGRENMKGYDICREINKRYPHMYVVGSSGDRSCEKSWIEAKARRFLPKPFNFKELAKLVKSYHSIA